MRQSQQLSINTIKVSYEMEALSSGQMPYYSASVFRGMLGKTLYDKSCVQEEKDCENCPVITQCAYGVIFEPTSAAFAPHLTSKMLKISPPFVINPPIFEEEFWYSGQTKKLTLTLFGGSVETFFAVTEAFMHIGSLGVGKDRITYRINKIDQHLLNETDVLLFSEDVFNIEQVTREERIWKEPSQEVSKILINLETPLRMITQGQLNRSIELDSFMKNVLRRCHFLLSLYGSDMDLAIEDVLENLLGDVEITFDNVQWMNWQRYSARLKREMTLGGLIGTFQLEGSLTKLLPYLRLASYGHIGKQTVFGLGKFSIYEKVES